MNHTVQRITNCVLLKRCYVTRTRNFYEVLGLNRSATSNEIKGAYYKLSKLYHPDKNTEKSVEAADKFREITEAYEVLGNFRLRKLYDKGIIHSTAEKYQRPQEPKEEDDPTTKFYQARMNKERTTATGRTPIYNFDEWNDAHYGGEFKKQMKFKENKQHRKDRTEMHENQSKTEIVIGTVIALAIFLAFGTKNFDVDRTKPKDKQSSDSR